MFKRLVISYIALIAFTILLLGAGIHVLTNQTFSRYLADQAGVHSKMLPVMMSGYYTRTGSWKGVEDSINEAGAMIGGEVSLADPAGKVIASTNQSLIGGTEVDVHATISLPVTDANKRLVGTVLISRFNTQERADERFLQNVQQGLVGSAVGISLVAALIGWFLARSISRPAVSMSQAASRIAKGDYTVRVEAAGSPELRTLGHSFNRMAEGMEQMEAMRRRLVADVSHDLRTPLTVLLGYLEGLRSDKIVDRQSAEFAFAAMDQEVRRLLRLVENLRHLTKVEAQAIPVERRPVSVSSLVEGAVTRILPISQKQAIDIESSVPDDLPDLAVEEEAVGQALYNLLENALRYTPPGGRVTISAGTEREGLWIAVTDTGPGIAKEHLPFIFERFYRGDQARTFTEGSGSGIGLSIVHAVMEGHGGRVTVESKAGQGSKFVLHFL